MYRDQERKAELRLVIGYIAKFGGMGSDSNINLPSLMELPLIDMDVKELPVRNKEEALEILQQLLNG